MNLIDCGVAGSTLFMTVDCVITGTPIFTWRTEGLGVVLWEVDVHFFAVGTLANLTRLFP